MPNVMVALFENFENDEEQKFGNSIPCTTPKSLADAHCSSAVHVQ